MSREGKGGEKDLDCEELEELLVFNAAIYFLSNFWNEFQHKVYVSLL